MILFENNVDQRKYSIFDSEMKLVFFLRDAGVLIRYMCDLTLGLYLELGSYSCVAFIRKLEREGGERKREKRELHLSYKLAAGTLV